MRGVALQVSHVPGKLNDWAVDLSRDRLQRFAHRPEERFLTTPAALARDFSHVSLHPAEARWDTAQRELC